MNRTHLEHALYALLIQLPFALFGYGWTGALFAIGFFVGREHAQAQVAYLLGDFDAFDMRRWSKDAQFDLAFPVFAVVMAAVGWQIF